MEEKKLSWKQLPDGDVLQAGTSKNFKTGNWRNIKPLHLPEKCIHCLICWVYCPDNAIKTQDGRFVGFDYDYCKGCGICAHECPKSAIVMESEQK